MVYSKVRNVGEGKVLQLLNYLLSFKESDEQNNWWSDL